MGKIFRLLYLVFLYLLPLLLLCLSLDYQNNNINLTQAWFLFLFLPLCIHEFGHLITALYYQRLQQLTINSLNISLSGIDLYYTSNSLRVAKNVTLGGILASFFSIIICLLFFYNQFFIFITFVGLMVNLHPQANDGKIIWS